MQIASDIWRLVKPPSDLRLLISGLCALLLVFGSFAEAQQLAKLPKIGFLGVRPDDSKTTFESFKRQFQMLGHVDGKNIVYEYRNAENKPERLPTLVDELIRVKVDVLVVAAGNEVRAAKNATKTIPIVGLNLTDPVQSGLIESLAHPGANLTGITPISEELSRKRLELLKETVAKLVRVAVLWDPKAPSSDQTFKNLQPSASALGLQLHSMEVSGPDKFDSAFRDAIKAGSGAVTVNFEPAAQLQPTSHPRAGGKTSAAGDLCAD